MTRLLAPPAVVAALAAGLWLLGGVLATGKWSAVLSSVLWFFAVSAVAARIVRRDPRLRLPVRGTFAACAILASVAFNWTSVRTTRVDERVPVPAVAVASDQREAALRGEATGEAPASTPTATTSATPMSTATPTPTPTPRPKRRAAATRPEPAVTSEPRTTPTSEPGASPAPTATPAATPAATPSATPSATPAAQDARLARGAFRGADGHAASGTATAVRRATGGRRLTFTGFEADGGLDVRVYLVDGDGSDVSEHVELGRLKGERGDQQYTVPASVDLVEYRTVVLWCVPYTVRVAVARLR